VVTSYSIAEVAERSGSKTSTLRYYEKVGLLPAPARNAAGYRSYDDDALARLGFIARAKQLGCTLEEITDLVVLWDSQRCAPVQTRLQNLVTTKIDDAGRRVAELTAFTVQLHEVAAMLSRHTPDGPCDEHCGCGSDVTTPAAGVIPAELTRRRAPVAVAPDPPVACTLEASEMPDRLRQWQAVVGLVEAREPLADGMRLTLTPAADIGAIALLCRAEQHCCAFLRFALTVEARGTALEVRGPPEALPLVHSMFGSAP